jgi:hypothetical protein
MRAIVPELLRRVGENSGRATGDVWNGLKAAVSIGLV